MFFVIVKACVFVVLHGLISLCEKPNPHHRRAYSSQHEYPHSNKHFAGTYLHSWDSDSGPDTLAKHKTGISMPFRNAFGHVWSVI